MFAAVREKLVGAWRRLREGSLAKLFVFEFVVVLLGVLAAQLLQNWFADQGAERRAEEAIARLDSEVALAFEAARIWDAALPCLLDRTTTIMMAASDGRVLPAAAYSRPVFWSEDVETPSEEVFLAMRARMSEQDFAFYDLAISHANRLSDRMNDVAGEWEQFSRLNPQLGKARPADFDGAREAGASIRSHLRTMRINTDILLNASRNLPIPPVQSLNSRTNEPVSPIETCDQIDKENAVFLSGGADE